MLQTGVCSITFRQLKPERIVDLTTQAKLDSIEWGGDVHVPHGDVKRARHVHRITTDSGLFVSAYGSYYRLADPESPDFEAVLDTAEGLETSIVRVWAGTKGTVDADAAYRQAVIDDALRIVAMAETRSIGISLEYHNNTLTDSLDSTLDLLASVRYLNTYWQPPHTPDFDAKTHGLRTLLPYVTHIHVFHWNPLNHRERYPLADGESDWNAYIDIIRTYGDGGHIMTMEFVCDDDEAQFLEDAQTLHRWLADE